MGRLSVLGLGLLLLSLAIASFATTPSDYFSASDASSLKQLLLSKEKADGSFGSGIDDTHYTISALKQLNAPMPNTKLCSVAKDVLKKKGSSVESVWHAISLLNLVNCGDMKVDQAIITLLENGVKNSGSLTTIYQALSSIAILKTKGNTFSASATSHVVSAIAQLGGNGALYKDGPDSIEATSYHAGLAFHSLAILKNHFTISQDDAEQVDSIIESADQIFTEAVEGEGVVEFPDNSLYVLRSTSTVLTGLNALVGAGYEVSVTQDQLAGVAEFLIQHKHVSNSHDAHYLLSALHTLVKNNFGQSPLVLSLPKKSILATATTKGEDSLLQVRLTDVFGHPATKARVYVVKAFAVTQPSTVILQNQEAHPVDGDSTLYSFNFLATKPDQGFYTFEFSVTPLNKNTTFFTESRVPRNVKVVVTAEITDVSIQVADSAAEEEDAELAIPIHYPKQLEEVLRANYFQHLFLSFRVRVAGKPVNVQQAFVIFTNQETQEQSIFVANRQGKKYKLSLGLSSNLQAFNAHNGKYSVLLVVGDSFLQNSIAWQLGSVQLNFGKHAAEVPVAANTTALPELHHTFNPPAKRPRPEISLFFTVAVLVPLVLLFIGLIYIRANISGFPTGGLSFLSALGFQLCIGAIMGLYIVYWLYLNMIQTLCYLALLGIPTIFIGQRALRHLAEQRIAEEESKKKTQ